jgi:hypothetical protein
MAAALLANNNSAAITPAEALQQKSSITVLFQPAKTQSPTGSFVSDGSVYDPKRGFGWDRNVSGQTRDRGDTAGIAMLDRAVASASFRIDLPDGEYLFELEGLDTSFAFGLAVKTNNTFLVPPVTGRAGEKVSLDVPMSARDGKASLTFVGGTEGLPNCFVSRLAIFPAQKEPERFKKARDASSTFIANESRRLEKVAAMRQDRREQYHPMTLVWTNDSARTVMDLSGIWLFQPAQKQDVSEARPDKGDGNWHTMHVPDFWKPIEWWLYERASGASHNFLREEIERCENLTFDYARTDAGWYRQWIVVPEQFKARRFVVRFQAVATISRVFWNGIEVGSHTGMFGPFECEVTDHLKFGETNLLAVYVAGSRVDPALAQETVGVAESVRVTREMISSLPHGGYKAGLAGIWQPVELQISGNARIENVHFQPALDGAAIDTEFSRSNSPALVAQHLIVDDSTGAKLWSNEPGETILDGSHNFRVKFSGFSARLWSPEHPNLYRLRTRLLSNGTILDEVTTTVGFRTFEAKGPRLYLNGRPYFLRGANMPPHGLRPNDRALAAKFLQAMRDGNTPITRFHMAPAPQIWLDAADRIGIGNSTDCNWPWIMMGPNPMPAPELVTAWKQEYLDVVKAARNHPSVLFWTIANEAYFQGRDENNVQRKADKYSQFSDIIRKVREMDPGKPIVFHSGYRRNPDDYKNIISRLNLDDGDIDDHHDYIGWYKKSPFHLDVHRDIEREINRPLISQEAATGYPDNDLGYPTEKYIRDFYVPQIWVGRYGTYDERPDRFLSTLSLITKEYAERIRRDRGLLSGWELFANVNWFRNVFDVARFEPYQVYYDVKKAYAPVLVSFASANRHFEAGDKFKSQVWVVHDDPDRGPLKDLKLTWRIFGESDDAGASGQVSFPACEYDHRSHLETEFTVPPLLPSGRSVMTLRLEISQGEEVLDRNEYELICVQKDWPRTKDRRAQMKGCSDRTLNYFRELGLKCEKAPEVLDPKRLVILTLATNAAETEIRQIHDYLYEGGTTFLIDPAPEGVSKIVGVSSEWIRKVSVEGEFADVEPGKLLDGLDPMDIRWWNAEPNGLVRVCSSAYQFVPSVQTPEIHRWATHLQPHSYIKKQDMIKLISWPLFEAKVGKGRLMVSSFLLAEDPLAKKFYCNLINSLAAPETPGVRLR